MNKTKLTQSVSVGLLVLIITCSTSQAEARKFCAKIGTSAKPVKFQDEGIGSHWSTPGVRSLPGVAYKIKFGGQVLSEGYTTGGNSSNAGCTSDITIPSGTYSLEFFSYGKPVVGSDGILTSEVKSYNTYNTVGSFVIQASDGTTSGETYNITLFGGGYPDASEYGLATQTKNWAWYAYAPAAETLIQTNAYTLDELLDEDWVLSLRILDNTNGLASYKYNDTITFPRNEHSQFRMIIGHEVGHFIMDKVFEYNQVLRVYNENSCSKPGCIINDCTYENVDCSHRVTSVELATTSMSEGWANYISAEAWNSSTSCEFLGTDSSPTIDCDNGSGTSQPNNFLLNACESCSGPSDPKCYGYSTELDWLRTFWQIAHSCSSGAMSIADWLAIFKNWTVGQLVPLTDCNAYGAIKERITAYKLSSLTCFTTKSINNGITYSPSSCNFNIAACM